jgi:hypothetical protein
VAWLGGLAYAFGGYSLSLIGSWIYFFGFSLLPLSILFFHRLKEKLNLRRSVGLSLVLTFILCPLAFIL